MDGETVVRGRSAGDIEGNGLSGGSVRGICEARRGAFDDPEVEIGGNTDADADAVSEAGTLLACEADAVTLTSGTSENGGI